MVTRKKSLVKEAIKLFKCDMKRQPYSASCRELVVSPANSRKELMTFLKNARKQILIYELKISDPEFVRLLESKQAEGMEVRIIGHVGRRGTGLNARPLGTMRLHARCILRDSKTAFLGSQSLRKLEMDSRREVGIVFDDASVVQAMVKTF